MARRPPARPQQSSISPSQLAVSLLGSIQHALTRRTPAMPARLVVGPCDEFQRARPMEKGHAQSQYPRPRRAGLCVW